MVERHKGRRVTPRDSPCDSRLAHPPLSGGVRLSPLRGAYENGRMLAVPSTVTIDEAFDAFLAEQRERLARRKDRREGMHV